MPTTAALIPQEALEHEATAEASNTAAQEPPAILAASSTVAQEPPAAPKASNGAVQEPPAAPQPLKGHADTYIDSQQDSGERTLPNARSTQIDPSTQEGETVTATASQLQTFTSTAAVSPDKQSLQPVQNDPGASSSDALYMLAAQALQQQTQPGDQQDNTRAMLLQTLLLAVKDNGAAAAKAKQQKEKERNTYNDSGVPIQNKMLVRFNGIAIHQHGHEQTVPNHPRHELFHTLYCYVEGIPATWKAFPL